MYQDSVDCEANKIEYVHVVVLSGVHCCAANQIVTGPKAVGSDGQFSYV
jgi:hypothetical protein